MQADTKIFRERRLARLVATATKNRLTFACTLWGWSPAIAVGGQTSEAGALICLRDSSSLGGRDPRVVAMARVL